MDAFDGHAARALNQSTKFGAMLDMLTDRCATMCLLATLCTFYPKWLFFFQLSMTIDISCHWIHLHTSLLEGKTSHKFMGEGSNPIIRLYYTSRPVLFGMCAGNEIFYASLYLLHFTYGPLYIFYITAILCFPVAMAKSAIALFQVLVIRNTETNVGILWWENHWLRLLIIPFNWNRVWSSENRFYRNT